MRKTLTNEGIFVIGDMNGYLGKEADGYHGVHGGNGFGSRNMEGETKQRRSRMNQVGAKQLLTTFW